MVRDVRDPATKKPKVDPEIRARIEAATGMFAGSVARVMTTDQALEWIEKQSGPDKMSKQEAIDFYHGIKDGLAIRMEALRDEMEEE